MRPEVSIRALSSQRKMTVRDGFKWSGVLSTGDCRQDEIYINMRLN